MKSLKKEVRKILEEEFGVPMTDQEFCEHWNKLCAKIAVRSSSLGMESFSTHERARYMAMIILSRVSTKN